MSRWYRTGTASFTNGSTAVTGTGTNWLQVSTNAQVANAMRAPDGKVYEIEAITASGALTLAEPYQGTTVSGAAYAIYPTMGLAGDLAKQVTELIAGTEDLVELSNSALASARVYVSTAAGIAAVADGEYFSVPSGDANEAVILYRRTGASAAEIKRFPNQTAFAAAVTAAGTATTAATSAAASASAAATSQTAAAASATSAASSQAVASAAALSAGIANVYLTKAAADADIASISANAFIEVSVDEGRANARTRYQKVSGAYVFVRELGDLTRDADVEDRAFIRLPYWHAAIAELNARALGGGETALVEVPRSGTMSQSGTTVTASTSLFKVGDEGRLIVFADGSEALIRSTGVSHPSTSNTCTVDRSQTVSSQASEIRAKGVVLAMQGDSIGMEMMARLFIPMYRAYGFGGMIVGPNSDATVYRMVDRTLAGGAAAVDNGDEAIYPAGGHYWTVPAGGTVTTRIRHDLEGGTETLIAWDLGSDAIRTDTMVLIWVRAAGGSITVQRKLYQDKDWINVETIADLSTGSSVYGFRRYKHALASGWMYRVLGVSGTARIISFCYFNRANPGFTLWPLSKGGASVIPANTMPSATLKELVDLINPDLRTYHYADYGQVTGAGQTMAQALAASSALWDAAAPRTDTLWFGYWDANPATESPSGATLLERNAVRLHALQRGDSYIGLKLPYKSYSLSKGAGLIRDDIHQTAKGQAVTAAYIDRLAALITSPVVAEPRNVDSYQGKFRRLFEEGRPVMPDVRKIAARINQSDRGFIWGNNGGYMQGAIANAIGTSDFSFALKLTFKPSSLTYLFTVSTALNNSNSAGAVSAYVPTDGSIRVNFRNAAGDAAYEYRIDGVAREHAGKTGWLTIVTNRARNGFDVYFDTKLGNYTTVLQGAGPGTQDLPAWTGLGTTFGLGGANQPTSDIYGVMFWSGAALSAAEVAENALSDGFTTTVPDFAWFFDEGCGRVLTDRSGNKRHGAVLTSTNIYNISEALFSWRRRSLGDLSPPLATVTGQTNGVLIPGDNVIANHTALQSWLLPSTPEVGDRVRIVGKGSGKWRVTQRALHQIFEGAGGTVGTNATTIGTGGHLSAGQRYDCVELQCITSNPGVAFEWVVVSARGTLVFA